MLQKDTYKTIESTTEGLFKDKGSKFVSYAFPVSDEETIKNILQSIKKEHYSARHFCYAYRLGFNGDIYRTNDDGEPSGTAGKPIYGQLLSNDLTNILIVVVRYFGGTLLGVSGLINAYRNAAADAILNSQIVTNIIKNQIHLEFDYLNQNSVLKIIKDNHLETSNPYYGINCSIDVFVRLNNTEDIIEQFKKIEGLKINI